MSFYKDKMIYLQSFYMQEHLYLKQKMTVYRDLARFHGVIWSI